MKFKDLIEGADPYTMVAKIMGKKVPGIVTYFDESLPKKGKGITAFEVGGNDIWYADADKADGKRVIKYNFEESQW
jgi:hypothetical protein